MLRNIKRKKERSRAFLPFNEKMYFLLDFLRYDSQELTNEINENCNDVNLTSKIMSLLNNVDPLVCGLISSFFVSSNGC